MMKTNCVRTNINSFLRLTTNLHALITILLSFSCCYADILCFKTAFNVASNWNKLVDFLFSLNSLTNLTGLCEIVCAIILATFFLWAGEIYDFFGRLPSCGMVLSSLTMFHNCLRLKQILFHLLTINGFIWNNFN